MFGYPYSPRKVNLDSFKLNTTAESSDYDLQREYLTFHKSAVCLETPFYQQLNFIQEIFKEIVTQLTSASEEPAETNLGSKLDNYTLAALKKFETDQDAEHCSNDYFRKYKFYDNKVREFKFSDTNEVVAGHAQNEKVLLEVQISQHPSKTTSQRESIQILDYLGLVGGFQGSLILLFGWIGVFFS